MVERGPTNFILLRESRSPGVLHRVQIHHWILWDLDLWFQQSRRSDIGLCSQ